MSIDDWTTERGQAAIEAMRWPEWGHLGKARGLALHVDPRGCRRWAILQADKHDDADQIGDLRRRDFPNRPARRRWIDAHTALCILRHHAFEWLAEGCLRPYPDTQDVDLIGLILREAQGDATDGA